MSFDISIIIVNYNVQYFIDQCLNSIFHVSDFNGKVEVIVVDNQSSDDSIRIIRENYPQVTLIENQKNVGFSVANNQGINIANGKYILLLNPDTLLSENTLSMCFEKMESNERIGALGARMVDGSGQFLPESKRGFPSPKSSFYRFSGLYKLFPKSAVINSYYQGNIDEHESSEIEILCGAFMFIRHTVLDEIGLLDEAFFMYGEDIDLSFRIRKAGYQILYFPETTIVHFKGESTKKDSVSYTKRFYNAMDIFANKHYKDSKASSFLKYLSAVIWIKGSINYVSSALKRLILPILDVLALFLGLKLISIAWAKFYFQDAGYYDNAPLFINFSLYTIIWFISILYGGGYDKNLNIKKLGRNILFGTILILAIYGLLDSAYRSSRAIILIATLFAFFVIPAFRLLLHRIGMYEFDIFSKRKRLLVLSEEEEFAKINDVLITSKKKFDTIERLPVNTSIYELREIIDLRKISEIICVVKEVGMGRIIELMSALGSKVAFKITGEESLGIVGSQSKNKSGEIYTLKINYGIQLPNSKRNKRTFDVTILILFLVLIPLALFNTTVKSVITEAGSILLGHKTIIGYKDDPQLPKLKSHILTIDSNFSIEYAKDYSVWKDLRYLWLSISKRK